MGIRKFVLPNFVMLALISSPESGGPDPYGGEPSGTS